MFGCRSHFFPQPLGILPGQILVASPGLTQMVVDTYVRFLHRAFQVRDMYQLSQLCKALQATGFFKGLYDRLSSIRAQGVHIRLFQESEDHQRTTKSYV